MTEIINHSILVKLANELYAAPPRSSLISSRILEPQKVQKEFSWEETAKQGLGGRLNDFSRISPVYFM